MTDPWNVSKGEIGLGKLANYARKSKRDVLNPTQTTRPKDGSDPFEKKELKFGGFIRNDLRGKVLVVVEVMGIT